MDFSPTLYILWALEGKKINSIWVVIFSEDIQFLQQNTKEFFLKLKQSKQNQQSIYYHHFPTLKHPGLLLSWVMRSLIWHVRCCWERSAVRTYSHTYDCHMHVWPKNAELNNSHHKLPSLGSDQCMLMFSNVVELKNKKVNRLHMESIIHSVIAGLLKNSPVLFSFN